MGLGIVEIECNGGQCKIVDRLPSVPIREISEACSYRVQGYEFMDAYRRGNWDGKRRLFHKSHRTFPIGLLDVVQGILIRHDVDFIVSKSESNLHAVSLPMSDEWVPRPYQFEAADNIVQAKIGVIRMATGGGKTVVAGHVMSILNLPTLFLVHTKDLLYQAIDTFVDMFGVKRVGQIGDGVVEVSSVTVATIQTVSRVLGMEWKKYEYEEDSWDDSETQPVADQAQWIRDCLDNVGVVFMDECHRVAAPTAMDVMASLSNPTFRIGLSASPWRDDGADLAITGCLGPIVYSINASTLADMGYLVKPIIRMLPVPPMQFPKDTPYARVYSQYIVENEHRNEMVVKHAASLLRRGKPTIVLVRHIKHGMHLQELISERVGVWIPFISGRDPAFVRKQALDDMREGKSNLMIASTIADEGLDIKPLQGLILAGGGKSSVKALQRVGRTLRTFEGKEGAEIVDFDDRARWLINHSAARQRLYETEPAWTVIDA